MYSIKLPQAPKRLYYILEACLALELNETELWWLQVILKDRNMMLEVQNYYDIVLSKKGRICREVEVHNG